MSRIAFASALLLTAFVVLTARGSDQPLVPFVGPEGVAGRMLLSPALEPTVERARRISPDFAAMDAVTPGPRSLVLLDLFDDARLTARVDRVELRDLARYTWYGRVLAQDPGDWADEEAFGGTFVMAVEEDAVTGAVWLDDGRTFEIRHDATGQLWATELNQAAFAPCETGPEHCVHEAHEPRRRLAPGQSAAPRSGSSCPDDGSVIDVLVVYTPSARSVNGGTNGIVSLINAAVAATNNAFQNSQIETRIRLVHVAETNYIESDSNSTNLSRLRGTSDGHMDEVHGLRQQYGADMVALIHNGPGCGIAYLMTNLSPGFRTSAFSVTRHSCAVGNLTFAHELGHNLGSAHDRDNAGNALFSYSYGHRWVSTNGQTNRSVMAYSPGTRRPHFSNPNVLYVGTPTGIPQGQPGAADNARSINEAAFTAANWVQSVDPSEPVIVAGPQAQVLESGESLVFVTGAVGQEPLMYQWFRDGIVLVDDGRISGVSTPTLIVTNVTPADSGVYELLVGDNCGGEASATAQVTVNAPPCPADINGDGELNFFDLSAYLALFNAQDPAADLAEPFGVFNFFDVAAYLALYNAGCP
ncbi:MAG: M12 family metallo-peptidase [Phycisphaerales bacterium]|nr:immunoglobulin domain-containing protein [Planctomycetota bacterium]MCH8509274.1 M12 family metallo-peptidase [Phycisphaerales bacterium]